MKKRFKAYKKYFFKIFTINSLYGAKKAVKEFLFSRYLYKKGLSCMPAKSVKIRSIRGRKYAYVVYDFYPTFIDFNKELASMGDEEKYKWCRQSYLLAARLHSLRLRHGDLCYRNFLLKEGELYIFDLEGIRFVPFAFLAMREIYDMFKSSLKYIDVEVALDFFELYLANLKYGAFTKKITTKYLMKKIRNDGFI